MSLALALCDATHEPCYCLLLLPALPRTIAKHHACCYCRKIDFLSHSTMELLLSCCQTAGASAMAALRLAHADASSSDDAARVTLSLESDS